MLYSIKRIKILKNENYDWKSMRNCEKVVVLG